MSKTHSAIVRIIANYGHQFLGLLKDARTDDAQPQWIQLVARGKRQGYAVGDWVKASLSTDNTQGAIEGIHLRENLFYRSEFNKQKNLASNIDQVAIICATEPSFADELLGRALICAHVAQIEVLIVLNKADVSELLPLARERLRLYAKLGYRVIEVSANQPDSLNSELIPALAGKTTLLMGQSGMGKSSLINALIPDANLRTREISSVLNSGKHTTTFSRLFDCDLDGQASQIIDSPGFEQFGMAQFSVSQIQHAMPEFVPYLGTCKFHNCTHVHEPACAILDAVARGEIAEFRHEFYLRLLQQLDYYEHAQY